MRRCGLEFRVTRHGAGPAERGGQSALRAPGGTGWLPRQGRPQRGCAQSQGTDGPGLPRAHRPFLPWGESMPLWLVSESHRTSQASTPESVTHRGSRRKPGGCRGGRLGPAPPGSQSQPPGRWHSSQWGTEGKGLGLGWRGGTRPEGPAPGPWGPWIPTRFRVLHPTPGAPGTPLPLSGPSSSQSPGPLRSPPALSDPV